MTTLGGRIRELREQMGVSQAQLAASAEVSQGYLCQLEREDVKNPSAAVLLRLASALYVDPRELLDAAGFTAVRAFGSNDSNYKAEVDPDLLRFLAGLSPEQQRYVLLLLQSLGQRMDALPAG
ncbi:MAG: helix-turn-helix transcriptional regulator [Chloroflexota bacterium]|nr:helix-turn-helix transcriptional regulator [Chloroflexota bacterium]